MLHYQPLILGKHRKRNIWNYVLNLAVFSYGCTCIIQDCYLTATLIQYKSMKENVKYDNIEIDTILTKPNNKSLAQPAQMT